MANTIGDKIKKKRLELGMTLKDLSDKTGIFPQLISDYENNRKEPGIKNIKILSSHLKLSINYLLDETGFITDDKNTYGNVLYHYFEGLKYSTEDKLIINRNERRAFIEINDPVLLGILLQMKDLLEARDKDIAEGVKNFNINILSNVKIGDLSNELIKHKTPKKI